MPAALTPAIVLALLLALALVLFGAYRQISTLRRDNHALREQVQAAQGELAMLDERVHRRDEELMLASGELAQLEVRDRLTGLGNRRHFEDMLANEFVRLKRSGQPLSVVLLQVDHFTNYNDVHGHAAADDCLRRIGATLAVRMKRVGDLPAHLGQGEFALLLPETGFDGGKTVAEHVRRAVEQLALPHNASSVSRLVTVSLGLATVTTTHLGASNEVLELARHALQRARESGGNRVAASQRVRAAPA